MIKIPKSYNYISAFLTFRCNFKCPYCINKFDNFPKYKLMPVEKWVEGLNRIGTREDLPITLSGGEPTTYPDFYTLVNHIDRYIKLDLLTNGKFCTDDFINRVPVHKFKREAKYASIRFSYHPNITNVFKLFRKVIRLKNKGYSVGIWAVDKDKLRNRVLRILAWLLGIDFRLKAFLDKKHGVYKYPEGVNGKRKKCLCKPSELLIAPDGRLFRCHHDLYHGVNSYGHLLDKDLKLPTDFMPCNNFGRCNPCDMKLKFNRFQEEGHCSVTIKRING